MSTSLKVLLSVVCICISNSVLAQTKWDDDLNYFKYPDITAEHIKVELPLYRFSETTAGEFMRNFCDTLFFNAYYPALGIKELLKDNEFTVKSILIDKQGLEDAKGCIKIGRHGIILIDNVSSNFLKDIGLIKTDTVMQIEYGDIPNCKKNPVFTTSIEFHCRLKIEPTGKINPVELYNLTIRIQDDKWKSHIFDWIEQFYREHGLQAGCGYYDQKNLYDSKNKNGIITDFEIIIPDNL